MHNQRGEDEPKDVDMLDTTGSTPPHSLCLPRKRTAGELEQLKKSYLSLLPREELESIILNKDKDPTSSIFPDDIVGAVATLQSRQGKSDAMAQTPSQPDKHVDEPDVHLDSSSPHHDSDLAIHRDPPPSTPEPVVVSEAVSPPPTTPIAENTNAALTDSPSHLPEPSIPSSHQQNLQPTDTPTHAAIQVPYLYPHPYHPAPPHPSAFPQPQIASQFVHAGNDSFPTPLHHQPQTSVQVASSSKGRGSSNLGNGMPSYEEMLVMAITELRDPEGSTPKSLFEWMLARFPLMNNFRPSAHQALQKAYKRGRLERIGTKYRLNPSWEGGNTSRRTTRRPQVGNGVPAVTPLPTRLPGFPWPLPVMPATAPHSDQVLTAPPHPGHPQMLAHAYMHPPPGTVPQPQQSVHQPPADEAMSLDFLNNAQTSATASPSADALLKAIGAINGLVENAKDEDGSETGAQDEEGGEEKGSLPEHSAEGGDPGDLDGSDIEEDDENDVLLSETLQTLAEQMRILAETAASTAAAESSPKQHSPGPRTHEGIPLV